MHFALRDESETLKARTGCDGLGDVLPCLDDNGTVMVNFVILAVFRITMDPTLWVCL